MAGSVNKVILVGNVGQDPEVRQFQNGGQVCSFSIATSENWKDKNTGERREKTEWHRISVFNEGLIRVAVARNPSHATPLSGTWRGLADSHVDMDVDVRIKRVDGSERRADPPKQKETV